jgi:hypothetical protein
MANPNPNQEQLSLGRGKRQKLHHQSVSMRLSVQTRERLEEIANSYDCIYAGKPWISGLLERIASGYLCVVPSPMYPIEPPVIKNTRKTDRANIHHNNVKGQ